MKPMNFPYRKRGRQHDALERIERRKSRGLKHSDAEIDSLKRKLEMSIRMPKNLGIIYQSENS